MRHLAIALTGLLLFACDGDGGGEDAGPAVDGAAPADAGPDAAPVDGGGRDSGPPPDGAMPPACSLPDPIDEGVTYERTLHVATTGSSSGDGSMGDPLDTIERAAAMATPGTRILVAAGTYAPIRLDGLAGEAGRPIAIVADGDVTLDAGGSGTVIGASDLAYVVIEGLTLAGAGEHGMNLDDGGSYDTPGHHVVLRDITVPGAGSGGNNDCIKMSGIDDFWVLGSDISACDAGEAIDMVGCHRGIISGNHFHDVVGNGVQAKGGSADTLIHGNLFTDIPGRAVNAGGSTGLPYFRPIDAPHEAANIRVVANVFARIGSESGAPIAYVGCDGCTFANNTIVDPLTWVAHILQESTDARFVPSRNGLFVNNIVVLDTSVIRTFVNVGGGTAPDTFTFANNLWLATDQGAGWGGPTYSDGLPAEMSSVIGEDPLFANRAGGDYHIMPGSPAGGIGQTLPFSQPPDYDLRCYGEPPSAGAFELPTR